MIDYWYKKLWYLFKRYGDPKLWKKQIKIKYGLDAWNENSLKVLYSTYIYGGRIAA